MTDHIERVWYRNERTGDIGYLETDGSGQDKVRLDRPNDDPEMTTFVFDPNVWVQEKVHREYTIAQIARVAFEADRAVCFLDRQHDLAKREWASLKTEERAQWYHKGPSGALRQAIYTAIMGVLRELAA